MAQTSIRTIKDSISKIYSACLQQTLFATHFFTVYNCSIFQILLHLQLFNVIAIFLAVAFTFRYELRELTTQAHC